jgi:hypothetical protein
MFIILRRFDDLPDSLDRILQIMDFMRHWLLVFLILLPMAMTMTLIWKIKEVIFASVFSYQD